MPVGVMIVDDSFLMRTVIKKIIADAPDVQVLGEAENGQVALDKVRELKPDVVLLDIEMPVMDGLELMKRLKLVSRAKVVIISSVAQVGSPQAVEARRLGAVDVVAKPSGAMSLDLGEKRSHEILKAIRKAANVSETE
ncbi:MAG: response regulator [Rhodospirillales bacterium]|nr:response regulator [Rhodospirillales bacterium]